MPSKSRETIQLIQHELARKGFDPGLIDGVWGRRTEQAVRAFQADHDLLADGIVGPKTWTALFGEKKSPQGLDSPAMPWFEEAQRLVGVKELAGHRNNNVILDWATGTGIPYKSDDIPWCGLFVAHCVGSTLSSEPLPTNPLGARNWRKFGAPCAPCLGAVLVFWRVSPNGFKGHVGFYAGQEGNGIFHVLGGNQADSVSVARIAKDRLLEARWPSTAPLLSKTLAMAKGSSVLSTDEA
jgi:uncharacterized protein (TIGR02594 family)